MLGKGCRCSRKCICCGLGGSEKWSIQSKNLHFLKKVKVRYSFSTPSFDCGPHRLLLRGGKCFSGCCVHLGLSRLHSEQSWGRTSYGVRPVGSVWPSEGRLERKEGLVTISFHNEVQAFHVQLVMKTLRMRWGAGVLVPCVYGTRARDWEPYPFCLTFRRCSRHDCGAFMYLSKDLPQISWKTQ